MSFKKTGKATTLGVMDNNDREKQAQPQQQDDNKKSAPKPQGND